MVIHLRAVKPYGITQCKVDAPRLDLSQTGRYSIYLLRWDWRLSWPLCLVIYWDRTSYLLSVTFEECWKQFFTWWLYSDCLLSQFFNASVTNLLINSVQICLLYFILWLNRYLGGSILKNFVVCSYNVLTDTTVSLDMILCHTVLLVIHVLVLEVFL